MKIGWSANWILELEVEISNLESGLIKLALGILNLEFELGGLDLKCGRGQFGNSILHSGGHKKWERQKGTATIFFFFSFAFSLSINVAIK